jgi:hypothetical protein
MGRLLSPNDVLRRGLTINWRDSVHEQGSWPGLSTLSLVVSQRTREIGIRVALGANRWGIARDVATRAVVQIGTGPGMKDEQCPIEVAPSTRMSVKTA